MKLKRILPILLVSMVMAGCSRDSIVKEEQLTSPDGNLSLSFYLTEKGVPSYSLKHGDTDVVLPSKLGFVFRGKFRGGRPDNGRCVKVYGPDLDIRSGFKLSSVSRDSFDQTWDTVWGEESHIRNNYNELAVTLVQEDFEATKMSQERGFKGKGHQNGNMVMVVRFRLYDDGLGFRYEFPAQEALTYFTIKEEYTEFRMAGDHLAWWVPGDVETQEYNYMECRLSEIPSKMEEATDYKDARQFSKTGVQTSLQMRSDDGLYINIHEAAVVNYPATHLDYNKKNNSFTTWLCPDAEGWKGHMQTPSISPWRTIMVVDDARKALASRLILNLNEPCALKDVSWIHPVKYMGVWWEMITGKSTWSYTDDFAAVELGKTDFSSATPHGRHGACNENVRKYIDFASENGFDAVLVEGWDQGWEDWYGCQKDAVFDFVTPYPDFDLPALNSYAHSRGIRLVMHHESSSSTINYERHLNEAFDLMNRYGYNAAKTGYVGDIIPFGEGHYSQPMVNHYNYVLAKAAEKHIMINAHEAVRPSGLCRTWPNLIGNESARGTEYRGGIKPQHVTILPFTRLQGGPMDYTPGIFETDISRLNPKSTAYMTTTIAKQLALYVTMYSPLQMAADLPEHYAEHMDAFQFIKDVAVDWEQSRYLIAEPGEELVIARQAKKSSLDLASKGVASLPDGKKNYINGASRYAAGDKDVWFVGGVTDEKDRNVTFSLDFLKPGAKYTATLYLDAPDASGIAGIQPDGSNPSKRYQIEERTVSAEDTLNLWMAPSGGFAIAIKEN